MTSFFCLGKKVGKKALPALAENAVAILALAYLAAQLVRWHGVGFRIIGL